MNDPLAAHVIPIWEEELHKAESDCACKPWFDNTLKRYPMPYYLHRSYTDMAGNPKDTP